MVTKRRLVEVGAVLCALAGTGCGSNDEPTADPKTDPFAAPPADLERYRPEPLYDMGLPPAAIETRCAWTLTDESGKSYEQEGLYFFEAMNTKLAEYEVLRELSGLEVVTTCDEARDFLQLYAEHSAANPDFDVEAVPEPPEGLPLEEDQPQGDEDKIFLGQSAINFPVVELLISTGGPPGLCSGFFISRTVIATANHCLRGDRTWVQAIVTRKNNFGAYTWPKYPGSTSNYVWVYQYRFPGWLGVTNPGAFDPPRDFGLLYIDPKVHAQLPNTTTPSAETSVAAMRMSTATTIATGTSMGIWGWGFRQETSLPPRDLFTAPSGQQITVSSSSSTTFQAIAGSARTCFGDSGAPTTRLVSGQYVAMGGVVGVSDLTPGRCAILGETLQFTRLSDKTAWIFGTLQSIVGTPFKCGTTPVPCKCFGSGADAYTRCW